jgi:two-component system NarL family response regulator
MRVLLVDDHALFLQSLKMLLTAKNYEVVGTAADGLEALKQARLLTPELILMDIEMPDCDGLAATRLIKAEMPLVKIVMLTVSSSDEHLFEAVKSGASGYLLKSQPAERFLELLAQVEHGGAALPASWLPGCSVSSPARRSVEMPVERATDLTARQRESPPWSPGPDLPKVGGRSISANRPSATTWPDPGAVASRNRAQVIAYAARHGLTSSSSSDSRDHTLIEDFGYRPNQNHSLFTIASAVPRLSLPLVTARLLLLLCNQAQRDL